MFLVCDSSQPNQQPAGALRCLPAFVPACLPACLPFCLLLGPSVSVWPKGQRFLAAVLCCTAYTRSYGISGQGYTHA
eukprot:COSAG06_NODE_755_length_12532_cov_10.124990_13_plen_77_part_00